MGKTKKILFCSSEAVPFVKSGGLADVCGALPRALKASGHDVRLVLPRYWAVNGSLYGLETELSSMGVNMGGTTVWCSVLKARVSGLTVYFIEHENYFGRSGLYDDGKWAYLDNPERFGFFAKACLQLAKDIDFRPDIIHANDWQTALIPAYLKIQHLHDAFFKDTASVFTIHNIGYQGTFPAESYGFLSLGQENFTDAKFENYGGINFMKGAIFYADAINTVSPSYAGEIMTDVGGNGLAPYIIRRKEDLSGILNGSDYDHWDPEKDTRIPANYSKKDLSGKRVCKEHLQEEFHLRKDPSVPVIGIVSRFVEQKGLPLLARAIEPIIHNMRVQFAIVGNGEKYLEDFFGGLPARHHGRVGAWIGYNNEKAHLIEAGSDFFLMPSLYEPCGLNQIYSMKYGTLPIVRDVGGLKDTVRKYDEQTGSGTGFSFHEASPPAIYYSVGWAVSTYYDRPHHMAKMIKEAMEMDFSWKKSAVEYDRMYEKALARRKTWG